MKSSEYVKLATAKDVARLQAYVNEYAYSKDYRVDPETLMITNVGGHPVPEKWIVIRHRGGFLFGRRV